RTPLILSDVASNPELSEFYRQALFLAAQLGIDKDYRLDRGQRLAHLTTAGQARAALFAERIGGDWHAKRRREETLCLALAAQHLFLKDVHYLVRGQQIIIIDDTTGRQAQGRVWSRGLHQLIEAKEGCAITQSTQTLAQITFQRFFARYLRISGISGTVAEAEDELLAIYGLPVVRVPLRFSCRRKRLPARVFPDKSMQWRYVADRVRELTALGQPVLIGTGSVNDSDALSTQLAQAGVPHTVLNARNDANEAHIVAQAGQRAAVTVSTNMAGRGTDIGLGPGVAALGGLYVIACQANDSRRIDRQLYGRCARQGDPGSVEQLYCMEDRIRSLSIMAKILGCFAHKSDAMLPRWLTFLFWLDQSMKERYRRREQWFLFLNDRIRDRQLAFVSPNE
ncbi:MAG: preprotein translocase subunit SecA, partial [Burkholderiaceae bacterium]